MDLGYAGPDGRGGDVSDRMKVSVEKVVERGRNRANRREKGYGGVSLRGLVDVFARSVTVHGDRIVEEGEGGRRELGYDEPVLPRI